MKIFQRRCSTLFFSSMYESNFVSWLLKPVSGIKIVGCGPAKKKTVCKQARKMRGDWEEEAR